MRRKNRVTVADLENSDDFKLIAAIGYDDLKAFIVSHIELKNPLMLIYSVLQVLVFCGLGIMVGYYCFGFISNGKFGDELKIMALAFLFSFTVLIVIHELIHAAFFYLFGKRNIGFGVLWRKFMFYTETHREVLSRREMTIVGLAPFFIVSLLGALLFFFSSSLLFSLGGLTVALLNLLFCAGDVAIVVFLFKQKPHMVYTFDDRDERKSYYYVKIK